MTASVRDREELTTALVQPRAARDSERRSPRSELPQVTAKRVVESVTEEPLLYFASPIGLAPTSFAMSSMADVAQDSVALLVESEHPRPLAVLTGPELIDARRWLSV